MRWARRKVHCALMLALLPACALNACAANQGNEHDGPTPNALWAFMDPGAVTVDSTVLDIGVQRSGCADGFTGEVADAQVVYEQERIVVNMSVEPIDAGPHDCQDNETVPYQLNLEEPVGNRQLVDGGCADSSLSGTTACSDGGVRWKPEAGS